LQTVVISVAINLFIGYTKYNKIMLALNKPNQTLSNEAFISYGKVLYCKDGITEVAGLCNIMAGEAIKFSNSLKLMNYNLSKCGFVQVGFPFTFVLIDLKEQAFYDYKSGLLKSFGNGLGELVFNKSLLIFLDLISSFVLLLCFSCVGLFCVNKYITSQTKIYRLSVVISMCFFIGSYVLFEFNNKLMNLGFYSRFYNAVKEIF
jgi:hypothetical protein